jgi:hypothetical protein
MAAISRSLLSIFRSVYGIRSSAEASSKNLVCAGVRAGTLPVVAEEIAQDGAQILLVLHDENAFAHAAPPATAAHTGSSMRNVEPCPSVDST